jgi:hypothetical protein
MIQLPAIHTPQFSWCRARLPGAPRPVPPIYPPEVAAEAIVWAARHRRREVWVGRSTWGSIVGHMVVPSALDLYLGRFGYDLQQSRARVARDRPDNLFAPVRGDHGAHGRFDRRGLSSAGRFRPAQADRFRRSDVRSRAP